MGIAFSCYPDRKTDGPPGVGKEVVSPWIDPPDDEKPEADVKSAVARWEKRSSESQSTTKPWSSGKPAGRSKGIDSADKIVKGEGIYFLFEFGRIFGVGSR
eukprot:191785-Amorphochlora_amoeboformis.AAC.1